MEKHDIPQADELFKLVIETFEAAQSGHSTHEGTLFQLLADCAARMYLLDSELNAVNILCQVQQIEINRLRSGK